MTTKELFALAIKKRLFSKFTFIEEMFNVTLNDSEYKRLKDKGCQVVIDKTTYEMPNNKVFDFYGKVTLDAGDMGIIKKRTDTTYGIALLNYLILELNDKLPFEYSNEINIKSIEVFILEHLDDKDMGIEVLNTFANAIYMINSLDDMVIVATTPKTIVPPPNIDKFKKELIKKYKDEYGDDVFKDRIKLIEFEDKLIEFYKDYIKDDPTYGITTNGKMIDIVAKKLYLTLGYEGGFQTGDEVVLERSINDGFGNDPKVISTLINYGRSGPYFKGFETRDSGVVAKNLLEASAGMGPGPIDCGTKDGIPIFVSDTKILNNLIGRFIVNNNVPISKDDIKYIGKSITIRSPMRCKAKGQELCTRCTTEHFASYDNASALLSIGQGGTFLKQKLKKNHGVKVNISKFSILDLL